MLTEDMCDEELRALGRAFYVEYTANSGNLNFRGEQCPAWEALTTAVRSHWCAVAILAVRLGAKP